MLNVISPLQLDNYQMNLKELNDIYQKLDWKQKKMVQDLQWEMTLNQTHKDQNFVAQARWIEAMEKFLSENEVISTNDKAERAFK